MEEGFLVSRRAISLAKQFLEASFDVVALQETRTRLGGTIRLPGDTATSTDAGPEAFYGAQVWCRTPASDRREHGPRVHDRTAFQHESLFTLFEDPPHPRSLCHVHYWAEVVLGYLSCPSC